MESVSRWRAPAAAFLASQCITLLGSAAVQMAIAWYAAVETSSGAWAAAMLAAGFVPQMAISPFAGALIDRHGSRKAAVIVADAVSAVAAAVLAVLVTTVSGSSFVLAALAVGAALRSACAGVQMPAVQSAVPLLVPETALMRYNGIASTVQGIVQFAAAPLAALVLAFGGMAAVMALDVLTAAAAICVLACAVSIPDRAPAHAGTEREDSASAATRLFADAGAGLRYVRARRDVAFLLAVYGAFVLLSVPSGFFVPLLMERAFEASYIALAAAEALGCASMAAGGAVLAACASKAEKAALPAGLAMYGAGSIGIGLATGYPAFLVSLAVLSAAILFVQAAVVARLQACVDSDMTGRVFGLMGSMYAGFVPLASVVFGPCADIAPAWVLPAACGAAIVVLGTVSLRPHAKPHA